MATNYNKIYFLSPDPMIELKVPASEKLNRLGLNSGNLAFTKGVVNLFDSAYIQEDSFIGYFNRNKSYDGLESSSLMVIPLANHLDPSRNLEALGDFLIKLSAKNINFLIFGLGSQFPLGTDIDTACHKLRNTKGFLKFIQGLKLATILTVRGDFTKRILGKHGVNASSFSCPSILINMSNPYLGRTLKSKLDFIKDKSNLNISINTLKDKKLKSKNLLEVEETLFSINGDVYFIHQTSHENGELPNSGNIMKDISASNLDVYDDIISENMHSEHNNSVIPFSMPEWFDFLEKNEINLNIGMRMHGNMISLSKEIFSIVIPIDLRMHEIIDKLKIPYLDCSDVSGSSVIEILNKVKFDPLSFDLNRRECAAEYVRLFMKKSIPFSFGLKYISEFSGR